MEVTDPIKISNTLNSFFTNIGKSVEEKIPRGNKPFSSYLHNRNPFNIVLNPCTNEEVKKYISEMNVSKATGPVSVPTSILKQFTDEIMVPLVSTINKSLNEGIFPDILKSASVCPIYKKGERTICANYRPISLLSNLSKLFEKAMYSRIELFLSNFETIYKLQFGFRKKHSTEHALLSMIEEIRRCLDKGMFSCGVFIDLEKAFDTVNHKILIHKLDHYGIRENSLSWIKSYLSNRKQLVNLNGVKSNYEKVSCGVPQGSILGPLLFLIYINDMHIAVKSSIVHHFADDTNLLFSSKNPQKLSTILNTDLKLLYQWLCANRLSLNVSKTEFIIFKPPKKSLNQRITLTLNRTRIYESTKIKYLGIILDARLNWNHHINELSKKLNRSIGMIYKIRSDCTKQVLVSLYFSIFHSHLSYGLTLWGLNARSLYRISLLQKRIIRAITFSDYNCHTAPLLKNLEILALKDLFSYKTLSLMWDFDHDNLPNSLASIFLRKNDVHKKRLRNTSKNEIYTAHLFKNKHGYESFTNHGGKLLNEAKQFPYYDSCKSKTMFLSTYKKSIFQYY